MRKILFMLDKVRRDLNTPKQRYPLAEDMNTEKLGHYYFVFDENRVRAGKDQALIKHFDENGIPVNSTYVDVEGQDYVYFPISIGQMGLAVYHTWLRTGDMKDRDRFMHFAVWFLEHAEVSEQHGARWLTEVPLPQYHTPPNWASAFSQARGLNILLRAYQESGDSKYADLAAQALKPFTLEVKEGGVVAQSPWGPFYEEYTAEVPTLVLNGMIFALFGIYDYVRVFPKDELAAKIFNDGMDTVEAALSDFDLGYWSRYNYCKAEWYPELDPATIQYQRLHIAQLQALYKMSGRQIFDDYARRFRRQDHLLNAGKAYYKKFYSLRKLKRL